MKFLVALLSLALVANAEVFDDFENFKLNISLKDITFTLYTRKHGNDGIQMYLGDKQSIEKAGFIKGLPVKVATHGYYADACGDSVQCIRKAFLLQADCNFISIDWSKYTKNVHYEHAALAAKPIGLHVSRFMKFLRDQTGFNVKDVHAMGHGLGAQLMSFISDEFPKEKVGRLSAFNPANPIFEHLPTSERLDPGDALFVDVYHTSTLYPGVREPVGTVDFYPNGGINGQPGCEKSDFLCQNIVSHRYFTYTIKTGKNYDAVKCNSLKEAESGSCNGEKAPLGIGATAAKPGIYYSKITQNPGGC